MRCPACQTENPDGAKFCLNCGHGMGLTCPECGTELPPQAKFCFACGAQVSAPSAEIDEVPEVSALDKAIKRLVPREFAERLLATRGQVQRERRIVTILFSDVEGSTAMAEDLDPEDVMEIMDGAFDVLIEPIYRYEGTLARLMGDAILAFFGAPIAHEDDAERACRTALEIVEGARAYAERLERERGVSGFSVRVGINTGLVVVGEVGSDMRVEYTAMGDAVNLAARMEGAAEPGTVLITEDTHKLIAPLFRTEALGLVEVKGKAEPVPVYRVLAPKRVPSKARGIPGLESDLVGRQAEFRAVQQAIERLQAGVGGVVTIVGEPGIGKSRLVAELRKQTLAQVQKPSQGGPYVKWVEGRCLSYGTSIAYLLWLDVLRGLLGATVEDSPAAVRAALWQLVQELCPDRLDDVYPYLGRLMSLPLTAENEAPLRYLEGEALKLGNFRAVETLIECAATQRPLALVCEDLHWADATSTELLEKLLALTDHVPLLFICVFRPQTEHGSWRIRETAARLYRHRHTNVWLDPLSTGEGEALIGNLLGLEALPSEPVVSSVEPLTRRILDHTEGNPFYVEETIRSLIHEGAIVKDQATGHWQATRDVADIPIPDSLQGVLTARIDRLPAQVKRVLQVAAVVGRIFLHRVLAAIADGEPELDDCLITLQREGMIRERTRVPEPEYIFKHELTREAAYSGLLKRERRILHRQVAETLERLFPDRFEKQLELLAHHWEQAGEPEKAINYLLRAGDRARRLGASLEVIDLYQRALRIEQALEAPKRVAGLHRIQERLGDVYLENLSRHDEALEHYRSFLDLAESEEDGARGARKVGVIHLLRGHLSEAQQYYETALARLESLPPVAEASRIRCGLAYLLVSRGRLAEATEHAGSGLEISRQISDTRGVADAREVMGIIAHYVGDLQEACQHFERSLELYRELGDLARAAQACNNVGECYRLWGQMDRALECLNEGLGLARRIGNTRDEALLLQTMAELFLDQGQWESALPRLERALSLAEESGVAARIIEVHRIMGLAYEGVGQLEDARRHLEIAEALSRETGHLRFAPQICLDLAGLNATQGEFDEAWRYIELAHDAAGQGPSDVFLGLWHRCRAYVRSRCADWDGAVAHLEESLRLLDPAQLPAEVGKTCLRLGRAYMRRGQEADRGRAREQLLTAVSVFRQIQAVGYLAQAEMWLKELT